MKKFIRHTLSAVVLSAAVFSCKQEAQQAKAAEEAEIPADILEAANKWKKFESEADPLFLQALDHTDLGHDKFSFSKGNFFKYLFDAYKESVNNGTFKEVLANNHQAQALLPVFENFVEDSGLLSWEASASSTMEEEGGAYMNKYYLLCEKGYENKLFFKFMGGEEKELKLIDSLPSNTAIALSGTANISVVVKYFDELAKQHPEKLKDLVSQKSQAEAVSEMMGIDFNKFLSEFSQGASLVLTLSDKETIKVSPTMEIPRPDLMLLMGQAGVETKKMIAMFETQAKAKKEVEGDITFLSSPQNIPVINRPAFIAYNGSEYVLGTDKNMISSYLKGETSPSESMQKEFDGMPRKGNGFFYLSPSAAPQLVNAILESPDAKKEIDADTEKMMRSYVDKMFFSGVYSLKPEGMTAYYRTPVGGTFNNNSMLLTTTGVTGVDAAMILPALGTARAKAKATKVKNSLRQFALGYVMYFSDGTYTEVPKDYHSAFEWELYLFEQPNLKFKPQTWGEVFSPTSPWKFFLKPGQKLVDIEDPNVPLLAVPEMKSGDKLLVLYGDGHVETKVVPGWRDLNLKQLETAL